MLRLQGWCVRLQMVCEVLPHLQLNLVLIPELRVAGLKRYGDKEMTL